MTYLVCFGLSIFFAYLALKQTDHRKKITYMVISIALPVILAGLRDYSIGIDVENYRVHNQQYWPTAMAADSLWEYLNLKNWTEPLFAIFLGTIAQTTGWFRLFLFFAHAWIITGVYIGAFRMKKHADPLLVITLFYLLFFNHSLNIMRQYMAMALIFAFLQDIEQKKFRRYSVVVIIASLIHSTALLAFGALAIYYIMYGKYTVGGYKFRGRKFFGEKRVWSLKERQRFIVTALGSGVLLFKPLCQLLIFVGILSDKYKFYMVSESRSYAGIVSLLLVFELVMAYRLRHRLKKTDSLLQYFLVCTACYLIFQQLTAFIVFGKRIAAYFSLQNIVTIGIFDRTYARGNKQTHWIARGIIVGIALMYWLAFYAIRNASQTMPYQWCF